MLNNITYFIIGFAAVSSGLMAGVYFAFSAFIMPSLKQVDAEKSVAVMNSINRVILRSWFMPLFFASTLASVLLAFTALFNFTWPAAVLLTASGLYVIGMFLCTACFNVPLNKALQAAEGSAVKTRQVWQHYLLHWSHWNHVRTLASLASCILYVSVLQLYGQ
ncbi:anthrone oxygenase family protein [Marinomonas transparens]|uniref:DUF1772 domain-containing protein n=1 Tax=Marinomonas transparens TaxID=2795388 RepID=A0A934N734_9GAMM|nr:anthrone oxygenase family protein [Marinomonas transparens]MBJ7538661.1 DUF1772 domain-containing protein [Marinomonas transparens]